MAERTLDVEGLNCPLPILKANRALKEMAAGETLSVTATDPGAIADFETLCSTTGNELLEARQEGKVFHFLIRRGDRL